MQVIDIYARVSRLRDREQTTTPAQVATCRAELAERGLPEGKVWIDDGKSAWDPNVTRPGWEALMQRLESGEAGGVVVYDLERFARQLRDGERLVTAAERGLIVLDSEGEYDLRKPGDKKNYRSAIVAAEYYSDLLRAKVRRGKRAKVLAGRVDMRRSFGFESDGVTHREDEAAVIREIAARLLAGEAQGAIARELHERGVRSARGAPFSYTTLRILITRPRNAGLIVLQGKPVDGVSLPGEPILDRLTFDRICALYAARRPGRPASGRYVLTGIALCGKCGAGLSGRPVSGTTRREYWCRKCGGTSVDAARLDGWAADWMMTTLADPAHAEAVDREESELAQKRADLLSEAADIGSVLDMLTDKLAPPTRMPRARYERAAGPLEDRLGAIESELAGLVTAEPADLPRHTIPKVHQDQIGYLIEWTEGDTATRRSLVLRALSGKRLIVGPGQPAYFDPNRVTVE